MNNDSWFPWFPIVYRTATVHLTAEQDGIYRRLIDYYMETREPLPDNDVALARISGVSVECFKDASSILRAFFKRKNDRLFLDFCDNQLDVQDKKARKRSEIATKAANARHKKNQENQTDTCIQHTGSNAEPMLKHATGQDRTIESKDSIQGAGAEGSGSKMPVLAQKKPAGTPDSFLLPDGTFEAFDGLFERFWACYPSIRDKGHKGKAKTELLQTIKKGTDHGTIIEGVKRFRKYCDRTGEKNPDAFRWIRDEGFKRPYEISAESTGQHGRSGKNSGYDPNQALSLALGDKRRHGLDEAE